MSQIDLSNYLYFEYVTRDPFVCCKFYSVYISHNENVIKFYSGEKFSSICTLIFSLSEVEIEKKYLNQEIDLIKINFSNITHAELLLFAHKKEQ